MRKQLIIIATTLVLSTLSLSAQSRTPEVTQKDSTEFVDVVEDEIKEFSTLDQAWAPVLVDHSIGVRFGWGTGFIRREPTRQGTDLPYPLWNGGISYRFDVPEQKYVGTIMFELQYVQKGYAYNLLYDGVDSYTQSYDVIELPILWQPYLPLGKGGSRVYLNAGPFISYTLSSYEKYYNRETGEVSKEGVYELDPTEDYLLNYGIAGGLGFYIAFGRWAITIDGRYSVQLSDIMRGPEFVKGNPFRTPVDHIGVSIGAQYKFSIGKDKAAKN